MLSPTAPQHVGVGAAAVRAPKTFSAAELAARTDALALAVGARVTASLLLLACVVVILIGAQSLLSAVQSMDRDVKALNEQLAIANGGLEILDDTMTSVPPTGVHLEEIVGTVGEMSTQVKRSSASIGSVADTTGQLQGQLGDIAGSTTEMRTSLESAAGGTSELSGTIGALNTSIEPLVRTQRQMLLGTRRMQRGLGGMNDSLAYTIRIMNWIAAPPTGQGMTIRADLSKESLPPLVKAEVEPVTVFPRNIWPIYTGP